MHKHNHCNHELKYCDHCDVVYCTKCSREWGNKVTYTFSTSPWIWYYYNVPYTVRWEDGGYSINTTAGVKVTDQNVYSAFYNSTDYKDTIGCSTVCTHNN